MISFFQKIKETLRSFRAPREDLAREPKDRAKPQPSASREEPASGSEDIDSSGNRRKPRRRRKGKGRPAETSGADRQKPVEPLVPWDITAFDVPPEEGKVRFHDLNLPLDVMHAVADLGFRYCSPIQAEILPALLTGKDALGQAQTGTGKTAAFLTAIITRMLTRPLPPDRPTGTPRALILAPTRELAIQISEEARLLAKYCPFQVVTLFGGMDYQKQRRQLEETRVDILVATPGRLIDFCQYDDVNMGEIEVLVIDEADRMLDMGFIPQVRQIVRRTPHKDRRQTLMFSATITGDVERLSEQWTKSPLVVEVEPEQVEVASVEQIVYLTTTREKFALLYNTITRNDLKRVMIFCNRRDETQRVADLLKRHDVNCAVISGEIPQNKRLRTLEDFRAGVLRVLVATDVAGRGLHIEGVSHVINYSLPHEAENYVHRIGRTGRAGATGTSISFACEEDSFYIPMIEAFIGHPLPCTQPDPDWLILPPAAHPPEQRKKRRKPDHRTGRSGKRSPRNSGPRT